MATADLTNNGVKVDTGNDNIVIVDNFQSVRGGRTLDVTGYQLGVVNAGHIIIQNDATGDYMPMPVKADKTGYEALPAGNKYAGILINTVLTKRPFAGIMLRGTVNHKAAPFDMASILDVVSKALPLIIFKED